jgi:hypothetical protein
MFKDLRQIPAVDPAPARFTFDEVLGLVLRLPADALADDLSPPNHGNGIGFLAFSAASNASLASSSSVGHFVSLIRESSYRDRMASAAALISASVGTGRAYHRVWCNLGITADHAN